MIKLSPSNLGPLRMPWKNAIAVGRAYELLREDLLQHLQKVQCEIGFRYCRFHGIFHDDMEVAVRRPDGTLAFQWHQVDKIYDALMAMGLRPFVEFGAMPKALASGEQTMFFWKMNVTPPRDYDEWRQLVQAFTAHLVDRYGLEEVRQWYFEVWNEPNLSAFWGGTQEEYWKLYDAAAAGVKAVDAQLRIGGPASSKASWIEDMIAHCHRAGVPLDFVSTHLYPQDEYVDYTDRQGSPHKLGWYFIDRIREARQRIAGSPMPTLPIHWTEFNSVSCSASRQISWIDNPAVDTVFGASFVARSCTELDDAADTLCWWTASDIFEEGGMPHSPFSCTYGLLTIHGLAKPAFNAFRYMATMRGPRLAADELAAPDGCGLVATSEAACRHVLLWNHEFPQRPAGLKWKDSLSLEALGQGPHRLVLSRIKPGAGSAWETWVAMGRPHNLSKTELELLRTHSRPQMDVRMLQPQGGRVEVDFELAPNEVLYLELREGGPMAIPKGPDPNDLARWDLGMGEKSR